MKKIFILYVLMGVLQRLQDGSAEFSSRNFVGPHCNLRNILKLTLIINRQCPPHFSFITAVPLYGEEKNFKELSYVCTYIFTLLCYSVAMKLSNFNYNSHTHLSYVIYTNASYLNSFAKIDRLGSFQGPSQNTGIFTIGIYRKVSYSAIRSRSKNGFFLSL